MTIRDFHRLLCCPACRGDLQLHEAGQSFFCAHCNYTFPIIEDIPVLFPCNVAAEMERLFGRYWDSSERADLYDAQVEGGGTIFGLYNHQSEMEGLMRYLAPSAPDLLLDAGCGNGRLLAALPESWISVGLDASLSLLRIARTKGRGSFHVCAELEHLPFRDGVFGAVASCRVIQHLTAQEEAVRELARVTRDRGMVLLELYNSWNPKTIYKVIRMSRYRQVFDSPFRLLFRSMSPFAPWGLSYDRYNNWFEVKRWLRGCGIAGIRGCGVGFGFHKYFFEPLYVNAFLERRLPQWLRAYYAAALRLERLIGPAPPWRYCLEKFVMRGFKNAPDLSPSLPRRLVMRLERSLETSGFRNRLARQECDRERSGRDVVIREDRFHLREAVGWLCRAQDATNDRGVSRGYSAGWSQTFRSRGWQPSYPETTGYIIPTMFDAAVVLDDPGLRERAVEMAEWERSIQMENGAVMGGTMQDTPSPAVFNTGQVIFGWLRTYDETGETRFAHAACRAADYLLSVQQSDGSWLQGNSRFASAASTTYNSRVGWALILLGQRLGADSLVEAGRRNIDSAIKQQNENGWFRKNCLDRPDAPLLHTICYAIEGLWGAGEALAEQRYLDAARRPAERLRGLLRPDGSLPGRIGADWNALADWSCLSGNAQLAGIWLRLYARTGDARLVDAARAALRFLKSTQNTACPDGRLRGGIKGSYPFDGEYGRWQVLNWPTKFFVDALILHDRLSRCNRDFELGAQDRPPPLPLDC